MGADHSLTAFKLKTCRACVRPTSTLGPLRYTSSDLHPIDPRLDGLKLSHVLVADVRGPSRLACISS
jgi:hypothetical protein